MGTNAQRIWNLSKFIRIQASIHPATTDRCPTEYHSPTTTPAVLKYRRRWWSAPTMTPDPVQTLFSLLLPRVAPQMW